MSERVIVRWHRLFGHLLDLLLSPYGVEVEIEVSVMSDPPRTDILLIRRHTPRWTPDQLRYLPNGLRESKAAHNLIELKVTESVSARVVTKLAADRLHYQESRELPVNEVAAFLISAKQPRPGRLASWGFEKDVTRPGIYINHHPLAQNITLVSLNELDEQENNAFLQLFASQQQAKQKARAVLETGALTAATIDVQQFTAGLLEYFQGDLAMTTVANELTPEMITERGTQLMRMMIQTLTVEERLAGLRPEERLMGLRPEERLMGLRPEERLMGLRPEERLMGLRPEERLMGLRPEEILVQFEPEERLAGLTPEELDKLEAHLARLKAQKRQEKPSA